MARIAGFDVYSSNRSLDPWSRVRLWCVGFGASMVLYGFAADPTWVEVDYVEGFGGQVAAWSAWITSWLPFSLAELLVVVLVIVETLHLLTAGAEVGAGRRSWHNALLSGLFHVVDVAAVLLPWFLVAFGLAYQRPPASERLALEVPVDERGREDVLALLELTRLATEQVNETYRELHGTYDAPGVTMPPADLDVDAVLDGGFDQMGRAFGRSEWFRAPRGRTKRPFLSGLLSRLGVSGIYVPFTGEATVNDGPPDWAEVSTAAHEKAHQRFVAHEAEASFYGFLAAVHADHPYVRYGGWQFARRHLLRTLQKADPEVAARMNGALAPGPGRDVIALDGYWRAYDGWMRTAHTHVNDAYLKLNDVEEGVVAYSRAALLVKAWLDTPDGRRMLERR